MAHDPCEQMDTDAVRHPVRVQPSLNKIASLHYFFPAQTTGMQTALLPVMRNRNPHIAALHLVVDTLNDQRARVRQAQDRLDAELEIAEYRTITRDGNRINSRREGR